MALPKELKIKTLADFAGHVEKLVKTSGLTGHWYRGIGSASSYLLSPSLYRHKTAKDIESLLKLEAKMLQDFLRSAVLHQGITDATDDGMLKTLFVMQHYGVPTRLLDWTTNPFIALYFALTSAKTADDDAAVWALDPVLWNEKSLEHVSWAKDGPLTYHEATQNYGPYKLFPGGALDPSKLTHLREGASCVYGITNNARMFAQRGVFTMFGRNLEPMEQQFDKQEYPKQCLTKLIIPRNLIDGLIALLLKIGYTDSVSYPDVQGLAMEIRRSHGF